MRQILCPILQVETLGTRKKTLENTRLMQWTWVLEAREAKQQNHSQCSPTALVQQ